MTGTLTFVVDVARSRNDVLAVVAMPHETFDLAKLAGENSDMNVQATEIAILESESHAHSSGLPRTAGETLAAVAG